MRVGLRFRLAAFAAGLTLAGPPALAQDTAPPATNTPSETIGPRELEGFSLNGTVTRPAPTQPSRTAPAPRPTPPATDRAPATTRAPAPNRTARDSALRSSPTVAQPVPDPFANP